MKKSVMFMVLLSSIVAVCSYLQLDFVPYVVSFVVILVIGLVAFNKITDRLYPIFLIGLALSMLWQQTMIGSYILGTDIHQEYFAVNKTLESGWDWNYLSLNGTSVLLNIVCPLLAKIGISVIWQFKLLFPIVFSFVPYILYLAFSKQINKKYAFYSVLFFMIVPVFTVEIATITKSMVAELFLALIVLVLFTNMRNYKKFILLACLGILACLVHYTVGTLVVLYLVAIGLLLLIYSIIKHKSNFIPVIGSVIVIVVVGIGWFANTGGGVVFTGYKHSVENIIGLANGYSNAPKQNPYEVTVTPNPASEDSVATVQPKTNNYLEKQDSLVRTALGMDWNKATIHGKIFRVIQYITQIAIIVGFIYLIVRRKKNHFSPEFIAGLLASVIVLVSVLLVPKIASIINTTRWYHSALFFASPLFVLGLAWIGKEKLIVSVIVIYYIFTSGFYYNVAQNNVPVKIIETPYSVAYSYKQGLIGIFNEGDINCAKWLVENMDNKQVHCGFTDTYLFLGYVEFNGQFVEYAPKEPHYLFLSSQNNKLNKMTNWSEPAMRKMLPLPDVSDMQKVYQSGDSVVYYVR